MTSGVNPTRLRRGATGTPALWRRAIARRESPPPAIGIESKSCSEFRAEEVRLLIIDPPGQGQLASTNKCLAQSNKSPTEGKATKTREVYWQRGAISHPGPV